jgi:hypothetical protein
LDTPEHVDSEKPNRQIDLGPPLYQLFSKCDFYFIKLAKICKNSQKLNFSTFWKSLIFFYFIRSKTVSGVLLPAKRKNSRKKFLNQSIFANFSQF